MRVPGRNNAHLALRVRRGRLRVRRRSGEAETGPHAGGEARAGEGARGRLHPLHRPARRLPREDLQEVQREDRRDQVAQQPQKRHDPPGAEVETPRQDRRGRAEGADASVLSQGEEGAGGRLHGRDQGLRHQARRHARRHRLLARVHDSPAEEDEQSFERRDPRGEDAEGSRRGEEGRAGEGDREARRDEG